jgi:hypothetical protein
MESMLRRALPVLTGLLACLCACFATGCSGLLHGDVGYAHPFVSSNVGPGAGKTRTGSVSLEAAMGFGPGEETYGYGALLGTRNKFGPSGFELGIGPGAYLMAGNETFKFFGSAGGNLLGAALVDGRGAFVIGSPYIKLGGAITVKDFISVTLALSADYQTRLAREVPNQGFVGLSLGVGYLGVTGVRKVELTRNSSRPTTH